MNHQKNSGQAKRVQRPKTGWQAWYASKAPVLQFGLKFGLLLLVFYAALATPLFDHALYSYLEANAWLANVILSALGQHTHVSEVTIQSPKFAMAIRRGCDAVEPTWLVCAAMLCFPATWKQKALGLLAGIVLLQALNLVRIVTLYWIGIHLPSFFNTAHLEIWPTFFIIAAIILFVAWRGWIAREPEAHVA